ncbi:ArpU family phage packaging/lysis transcriptional regulator [Terribacillus saccharophilus]|uniref:ArpU family phage packaging/lysis transcriptional regulator n=1 Tax=Terribacillus saccharophilus TaxID=361277 RepID=UPI002DD1F603|nr:ArpU family phage packaging/lysis transcriptional regulator [Terribacillus saccharophilus]MEC0288932.1 ArpU family phage packaging/lysis transcriptional regulator [Terribacillus saccharophilus]
MSQQMSFVLPEIDRVKTKERIEELLEEYRMLLLQVELDCLPKVTAGFTLVPPTNTNAFHSSTEDAAIKNVDYQIHRDNFLSRIQKAVNRLAYQERGIIIQRHMQQEELYDYEVYNELGMSERKYYRIKARAFYKLAFALKEEVYVQDGQVVPVK